MSSGTLVSAAFAAPPWVAVLVALAGVAVGVGLGVPVARTARRVVRARANGPGHRHIEAEIGVATLA